MAHKSACEWCTGAMPAGKPGKYCERICEREANAYKLRCRRAEKAGRPLPARPAPRSSERSKQLTGERERREAVKRVAEKKGCATVMELLRQHDIPLTNYNTSVRRGLRCSRRGAPQTVTKGKPMIERFEEAGILEILVISGSGLARELKERQD